MMLLCQATTYMFKKQPRIEVKPNATDRKLIRVGWLFIGLIGVFLGVIYQNIPRIIPTHFNLEGVADGFGGKSILWSLLGINILLYFGLMFLATKIKPWNFNFPVTLTENNAPKVYALGIRMLVVMNLIIVWVFGLLIISILGQVFYDQGLGFWMLPLIMIPIFGCIFYFTTQMMKAADEKK